MKGLKRLVIAAALVGSAGYLGYSYGGPFTENGSQPPLNYQMISPRLCRGCHGGNYDPGHNIEPHDTWSGSMMAQASRDPLFWAALDVANNDLPGIGDFCLRCHVPQGWLAGRSEPPLGSVDGCDLIGKLDQDPSPSNPSDFEGVTCHLCHRMMENPSPPLGQETVYYENAQYWVDDEKCSESGGGEPCRRGPYDYQGIGEVAPTAYHPWVYSEYHVGSDICGNCHNVTNPVKNLILPGGVDSGTPFPVERTYREWQLSDFAVNAGPDYKTCQNCHMPDATSDPAEACTQRLNNHTGNMATHQFAGGNAWVPDVIRQAYPGLNLSNALIATRDAALDMLQNKSATVQLTVPAQAPLGGTLDVEVRVTNLTGHKLPTGYPEGRRMWLNIEARDATNTLIWESGAYNAGTGVLTHDPAIKIYETKQGVWNFNGTGSCDVTDGSSSPIFHFVLNDCIVKDNRIPPLGFTGGTDLQTRSVGYTYPETSPGSGRRVNYDITPYSIPIPPGTPGPVSVTAALRYQTTSKEYVEFLLNESVVHAFPDDCIPRVAGPVNKTRAEVLYDFWNAYGKAAPVEMGAASGSATLFAPTPGEASGTEDPPMRVTAFDAGTGEVSLSYGPACAASDHTVYVGDLASVATQQYTEQVCAVGNSGATTVQLGSGSYFWVIVGHDGAAEGSYGLSSSGERPEDASLATCSYPQSLTLRCD